MEQPPTQQVGYFKFNIKTKEWQFLLVPLPLLPLVFFRGCKWSQVKLVKMVKTWVTGNRIQGCATRHLHPFSHSNHLLHLVVSHLCEVYLIFNNRIQQINYQFIVGVIHSSFTVIDTLSQVRTSAVRWGELLIRAQAGGFLCNSPPPEVKFTPQWRNSSC